MTGGFIKLDRRILDSAVFENSELLRLWVYILCSVGFEEKEKVVDNEVISLDRGQMLTGRKKLASILGVSESKVYRLLKVLEKLGCVNVVSNNRFSVITAVNWDKYQGDGKKANSKRTADEQQTDNSRTANGQQMNTYKEYKEIKNDKNDKNDKNKKENAPVRTAYGIYKNVYLSHEEFEAIKAEYMLYDVAIDNLSKYINKTGKYYPSHFKTVMEWAEKDGIKKRSEYSYDIDEFFQAALERSEEIGRELEQKMLELHKEESECV